MKEKKNFQKQKKEAKESRFKKKMSEIKRMIYLIYRNYRDGETQILAISLTYYSLLAIFPVVALVLGITKGFGLDKIFTFIKNFVHNFIIVFNFFLFCQNIFQLRICNRMFRSKNYA